MLSLQGGSTAPERKPFPATTDLLAEDNLDTGALRPQWKLEQSPPEQDLPCRSPRPFPTSSCSPPVLLRSKRTRAHEPMQPTYPRTTTHETPRKSRNRPYFTRSQGTSAGIALFTENPRPRRAYPLYRLYPARMENNKGGHVQHTSTGNRHN